MGASILTLVPQQPHCIKIDEHREDYLYCKNSPMIRTAQFVSFRAPHHTTPFRRATWTNISQVRNIHHEDSQNKSYSTTAAGSAESGTKKIKMKGNRENKPPQHEMVHFKGLMSEVRRFGDFRRVLHTGLYSQVVAMEIPVGGDIGDEVHTVDQILLFTSGKGLATVAGKDQEVSASDVVVVPAGTQHQFVNKGDTPLELITIYSPGEHSPDTVHKTKEEGDQEEEDGKDEAPEWSRKPKKENEAAGLVKLSGKYED